MNNKVAAYISAGDVLPALNVKMSAKKVISAAAATRDWQPIHHDHYIATEKSGLRDIILNAPSQTGWISRYITDWTGPEARIKSLNFKMKDSICPKDELDINGVVTSVEDGGLCGTWVLVDVTLTVGGILKTQAEIKVAIKDKAAPWHCPKDVWLQA